MSEWFTTPEIVDNHIHKVISRGPSTAEVVVLYDYYVHGRCTQRSKTFHLRQEGDGKYHYRYSKWVPATDDKHPAHFVEKDCVATL